jgi:hypothetical protein
VLAQLLEPPCTDPYARWCGRGGAARLPPIPINLQRVSIDEIWYNREIISKNRD